MPFYTIEIDVKVRKNDVDLKALSSVLRQHKGNLTNKMISDKLDIPLTEVEHWFRTDKYQAVPDAEHWFRIKELLGITTDLFDKQVTEFVYVPGKFDKSNRIHYGKVSPTLSCDCGNSFYLVSKGEQC